jgi:hypothetical protein
VCSVIVHALRSADSRYDGLKPDNIVGITNLDVPVWPAVSGLAPDFVDMNAQAAAARSMPARPDAGVSWGEGAEFGWAAARPGRQLRSVGEPGSSGVITVTGANLLAGVTVQVGDSPATAVTLISATTVTFLPPAGSAAGYKDVRASDRPKLPRGWGLVLTAGA